MQNTDVMPISLPNELHKYDLLWDLGEGFISTFCKSNKISETVSEILKSKNIPAHRMKTDDRIVVIYF